MDDRPPLPGTSEKVTKIGFHYIKSNSYRVIHADGAWGGLTPRLDIFMSFYSERPPIPQTMVHEVTEAGALGAEIPAERVSKNGIIREAEIGVSMDLDVAASLVTWLQGKIQEAEKLKAKIAEAQQTDDKPDAVH